MTSVLGDPEALTAEVIRRAQLRAVEITEQAHRRSVSILENARQECESLRRESEQATERQVAAVTRRNAARTEMEARRRLIQLREAPIERVWRAAEKGLRELVKRQEYLDVLKRWALRIARELGGKELTLAADPVGHTLLSDQVLKQLSKQAGVQFLRAPEPAPIWGGLISTRGRIRFDASFPTRLELAKSSLREQVFGILTRGKA